MRTERITPPRISTRGQAGDGRGRGEEEEEEEEEERSVPPRGEARTRSSGSSDRNSAAAPLIALSDSRCIRSAMREGAGEDGGRGGTRPRGGNRARFPRVIATFAGSGTPRMRERERERERGREGERERERERKRPARVLDLTALPVGVSPEFSISSELMKEHNAKGAQYQVEAYRGSERRLLTPSARVSPSLLPAAGLAARQTADWTGWTGMTNELSLSLFNFIECARVRLLPLSPPPPPPPAPPLSPSVGLFLLSALLLFLLFLCSPRASRHFAGAHRHYGSRV